jgi:hypothetical protein
VIEGTAARVALVIAMVGFVAINATRYFLSGTNAYIALTIATVIWLAGLGWYTILYLRLRRRQ